MVVVACCEPPLVVAVLLTEGEETITFRVNSSQALVLLAGPLPLVEKSGDGVLLEVTLESCWSLAGLAFCIKALTVHMNVVS